MELVGRIRNLNLNQKISESFTKSELVLTTDGQYAQNILIEFGGQKSDLLDPYKIGEDVKVQININGRIWVNPQGEEKFFNSIQGWRIERLHTQGPAPATTPPVSTQNFSPQTNINEDEPDDLPF
ncbi:hypothetical protein [Flavobacterium phage FL-1]|nr:hypothetical protein [Flavobacterium phage FL-1]